ncbi:hypothetical protein ABT354_29140 [Streptomyces sp. NPDC000594]|uniref:hypothetical protein n=1 Tax=Streptomyces sp. NPDC000594 TaxID=3154261 RepID=UPI00331BA31A
MSTPAYPPTAYIGSGPYCYSNALAMTAGVAPAVEVPDPWVIETLTGSPFGVQLIGGTLPFFDPYGWDPEQGLDAAVELLGLGCERTAGGTPGQALDRLRAALARGPVLVGPVDMGLLLHQPGTPAADFGDHYAVVLEATATTVLLHDPEGFPYATLPVDAFEAAWRAEAVDYGPEPYVLRTGFVRAREVPVREALRRSLPRALDWLAGRGGTAPVPPGTLGGAEAVLALAELAAVGLAPGTRRLLREFGVRVGARRLADAARALALLGLETAATAAAGQARALGALQEPLSRGDDAALAAALHRLAPGYERLHGALAAALGSR